MREVVEFRPDGTYTTGICVTSGEFGNCSGKAVPQIQGRYTVRGDSVILQNGLILQKSLDFARTDAPIVSLKTKRRESYGWRLMVVPDNPPTGNPPARKIYLTGPDRNSRQYHGFGRARIPTWQ
jgi:hypothetical protein